MAEILSFELEQPLLALSRLHKNSLEVLDKFHSSMDQKQLFSYSCVVVVVDVVVEVRFNNFFTIRDIDKGGERWKIKFLSLILESKQKISTQQIIEK